MYSLLGYFITDQNSRNKQWEYICVLDPGLANVRVCLPCPFSFLRAGQPLGDEKTVYNDLSPEAYSVLLSNIKTVFTQCDRTLNFLRMQLTSTLMEEDSTLHGSVYPALPALERVIGVSTAWVFKPPLLRPVYIHPASSIYRLKTTWHLVRSSFPFIFPVPYR